MHIKHFIDDLIDDLHHLHLIFFFHLLPKDSYHILKNHLNIQPILLFKQELFEGQSRPINKINLLKIKLIFVQD